MLHPGVVVSLMSEFVENTDGEEAKKQDCERKACWRLLKRLNKEFPRLPMCLCGDSLYACEGFFRECGEKKWKYILRFKEGSIPYIGEEYRSLRKREKNLREKDLKDGKAWYDYVEGIDYNGYLVNVVEYEESRKVKYRKGEKKGEYRLEEKKFQFLTNLPVSGKNIEGLVERGRMRWKIENEGFNTQKRKGYYLEHQYSKNYQAQKCHYYLIQIGHMISQVLEGWGKLWEKMSQSREQKHRRLLESFKSVRIKEGRGELERKKQIRFS